MTLYQITFTVNFLGLMTALWLGLYLITRNPREQTAWLTAFTLWTIGGLFLNILLALNPPPSPVFRPSALRFLFPFWPSGSFEQGANAWLQGWSVAPSIAFWHHTTMLMRPGKMNTWRWTRVVLAYLIAIASIEVQAFTQILFSVEGGDPLYLNSLRAGPLYSIFGIALIGLTIMCIVNLARSAYAAPNEIIRRQLRTLLVATAFTGLVAPVSLVSSGLNLFPMPMVVMSGLLTIFLVLIGFGVARYSALVSKRIMDRDFIYSLLGIFIITGLYTFATWLLVFAYGAPKVIVIFIPLLGVFTHTGFNAAATFFDRFFYHGETRQLRANLHHLRRLAGENEDMQAMLEQILESICQPIKGEYGIIFLNTNGTTRHLADYHWNKKRIDLAPDLMTADDMLNLDPGHFPSPLQDAALLVPLYNESAQVGALILGRPINGIQYTNEDIEFLLYPADQIADALTLHLRTTERLNKVAQIANEPSASIPDRSSIPVDVVDYALRNLFDHAYLADSPLAEIKNMDNGKTYIERGKAVHDMLLEALEKMKPGSEIPPEPIPREWFPYLILHDAYVNEIQNRDIMSNLYISEGTFNRTRRAAIRTLARTLAEM